jgi:transcriptional regulator with XRE-family HTH domain
MSSEVQFDPDALKRERLNQGLTLRELAARIDRPYQQVQTWENGRHVPSPRNLKRVADALGIEPKDLLK